MAAGTRRYLDTKVTSKKAEKKKQNDKSRQKPSKTRSQFSHKCLISIQYNEVIVI
jgi:hypothetical protein